MFMSNTIHAYDDARRLARRRLPRMVFDDIEGAAGSGHGEALNLAALADIRLQPRVLVEVSERELSVPLFDGMAGLPFGTSPMAMCKLAAPGAERHLAALSARHRVPLGVSTISSTPLEKFIEMAEGHAWFQLCFSGDGTQTFKLLDRAHAAGYRHLILQLRAIRQALGPGFPLFYDSGRRCGEDVVRAYAMGADFVYFGRAMQYAVAGGGERGQAQWWRLLAEDIGNALAQVGRTNLREMAPCLA
jgi:isopentenyl diphosphate isomerase/L-lactate dehydrogenase-like FMN-dependent dehydrogenase